MQILKKMLIIIAIFVVILLVILFINTRRDYSENKLVEEYVPEDDPKLFYVEKNSKWQIENYGYNKYENAYISNNQIVLIYLKSFINNAKYYQEDAYRQLDEEYKQKRFPNVQAFQTYIQDNMVFIENLEIKEYAVQKYENHTEYICKNYDDTYFILKEYGPMDFRILLDIYTIRTDKYVEAYHKSSQQKRTVANIDLFMLYINDKRYEESYELLADSFKQENFQSLQQYSSYVTNNFYTNNKINFIEFKSEGELLIYKVKIQNRDNENDFMEKTFIVKELEGTDFVLSFDK